MMAQPFDELMEMLSAIPYGTTEVDPAKQAKLIDALLVMSTGGMFTQDYTLHSKIVKAGNVIVSLLPEDSPGQNFALGALSVLVTVANTVNELKKGP